MELNQNQYQMFVVLVFVAQQSQMMAVLVSVAAVDHQIRKSAVEIAVADQILHQTLMMAGRTHQYCCQTLT